MKSIYKYIFFISCIPIFAVAQKKVEQKGNIRTISSEALSIPCEKQVLDILGTLEPPMEWIELSQYTGFPEGLRVLKSLTTVDDTQLKITFSKEKTLIQRRDRISQNEYLFDTTKKCLVNINTTVFKKPDSTLSEKFTDFDLNKILDTRTANGRIQLFYVWSPSMNLSITGVNEIRKFAKKKGYDLIVIADPMSSKKDVAAIASFQNWPKTFSKQLDSDILKNMNFLLHFPALIVAKNGKMFPVRPGYDEPSRLDKYVTGVSR